MDATSDFKQVPVVDNTKRTYADVVVNPKPQTQSAPKHIEEPEPVLEAASKSEPEAKPKTAPQTQHLPDPNDVNFLDNRAINIKTKRSEDFAKKQKQKLKGKDS